jgi:hypothetical protein
VKNIARGSESISTPETDNGEGSKGTASRRGASAEAPRLDFAEQT